MSASAATWLVVLVALLAANLPFVNERLFAVGPRRAPKAFGWRLLELTVGGGLTLLLGIALENSLGQRAPQGWEFYAAWTCLMLTLASPGFVWRYLRRSAPVPAHE
ncbi:MAG: DUF2818 family protein [Burkholderiales bacterium]|nr:DUF2818 family protein [Burkholderiales bacterium]